MSERLSEIRFIESHLAALARDHDQAEVSGDMLRRQELYRTMQELNSMRHELMGHMTDEERAMYEAGKEQLIEKLIRHEPVGLPGRGCSTAEGESDAGSVHGP